MLTPRQRSAFIQFDGRRSLDEVLAATASLGVRLADIDHLMALGLLAPATQGEQVETPTAVSTAQAASGLLASQEGYKKAYPLAAQLTASLGLRGFRLNLAVEGAANFEQLHALLPDIREVVGRERALALERALRE